MPLDTSLLKSEDPPTRLAPLCRETFLPQCLPLWLEQIQASNRDAR
ncbi:hypothetical protein [Nostoc sp.]